MIDYKDYAKKNCYTSTLECIIAVTIFMACTLVLYQLEFYPSRKGQLDCQKCHSHELQKQSKLAAYFKKNGSKTPEEMADAVLKTKSPRLLSAVAVRETGGNPNVRSTGYRKRHHGAFQVNPKHWGKVPHDPIEQALQAEAILTELTHEKGLVAGLNAYGGDTRGKYAKMILTELQDVPR